MKKAIIAIFAGVSLALLISFALKQEPKTIRGKKYFISHQRFYYTDTIFVN